MNDDSDIPEMNLAALRFNARMLDAIKGMKSSIILLLKDRGQAWHDYPAWDLVDGIITEYGDDPNAAET